MPAVQMQAVLSSQHVRLSLVDEAYTDLVGRHPLWVVPRQVKDFVGPWPPLPSSSARPRQLVVLTSGTTGTPKGATRSTPKGLSAPPAVLSRISLQVVVNGLYATGDRDHLTVLISGYLQHCDH